MRNWLFSRWLRGIVSVALLLLASDRSIAQDAYRVSWSIQNPAIDLEQKLAEDLIGDPAAFLQDGMDVVMELYNERPISVQLPDQIEATIVEADAVVKGQTASSSYKPAILDNGVRVMVPPHISAGTRIVVDVYEQTYVRRAD